MWIETTTLLCGDRATPGGWEHNRECAPRRAGSFHPGDPVPISRRDRQVASWQSAKLQPRVRFPLSPQNLAKRSSDYSCSLITSIVGWFY